MVRIRSRKLQLQLQTSFITYLIQTNLRHFLVCFTSLSILQQAWHVWTPAQHQNKFTLYIFFLFSFFSPWAIVSCVLSSCQTTLVGRKELDGVCCQGLMVSLPPQMVIEWDSHKSGPGSSAASVWGQPHYKQSGPPPGCRDVPVYGVQHGWSYPQQESKSAVCL